MLSALPIIIDFTSLLMIVKNALLPSESVVESINIAPPSISVFNSFFIAVRAFSLLVKSNNVSPILMFSLLIFVMDSLTLSNSILIEAKDLALIVSPDTTVCSVIV